MATNDTVTSMDHFSETGEDLTRKESCSESLISSVTQKPILLSYGFLSKVRYGHKSKNSTILSVTYNSKTCEYIIADSLGISAWNKSFASTKTSKLVQYTPHNFNFIKILLYCRSYNLYFALTKGYVLKIYNLNFHETFSIESDMNALIHMIFNTVTNELITASRSEIYIWNFGHLSKQAYSLATNFGLVLKLKWRIDNGKLINRITLDEEAQRLYCLSETNVWCYDLFGKLMFIVKKACKTHLSACAYSNNTVIAGSVDGQVSLLTTSGGKIHTFLSHSSLITEILIHPCDNQLIITASLDGYIKIFSLDLVEELYSLKVFDDGIEYMAIKSNYVLYCVSTKEIEEFDLNYLCQFWGQLRYPAQSIEVIKGVDKSNRVFVLDSDNTIKLFATKDKRKLCTVLPPPTVDLSKKVLPSVHDIEYNLVYILVTTSEVWVYTTKTDPACFIASINLLDESDKSGKTSRNKSPAIAEPPVASYLVKPKCLCIEVLPDFFQVEFVDADGVVQNKCNLLACGMDNGQVNLFNPMMKGRRENSLEICREPIIQLKYCKEMHTCLVTTKAKVGLLMRFINSNLQSALSIHCDSDIMSSTVKGTTLAVGFASGHIVVQDQLLEQPKVFELSKKSSVDHSQGVLSVSFHPTLDILSSAGKDGCVKIWSFDKLLLCEITLDCSLTSVCFLNSSGDILVGFQGHVFVIRNDGKYKWLEDGDHEIDRPMSQVYESPGIRYEVKNPPTPDLETMDKYLVPYSDMIFMTIGTWVVKNDDTSSVASDLNGVSFGVNDSDEESMAPTDIYQSSVFSLESLATQRWALPDCGFTPESSISDETEDEGSNEIIESDMEEDKKFPVKRIEDKTIDDIDSMARLEEFIAPTSKREDTVIHKMPEFAHGSSARLKSTKIDVKKSKIAKGEMQGKVVDEGLPGAVSGMVLPKESKGKESRGKERRIVKKSQKHGAERKRASSKYNNTKMSQPDPDSQTGVPADGEALNLNQEVQADKEAATPNPDGGYDSTFSNKDQLQDTGPIEPEEYGTVLAKGVIRLKKAAFQVVGMSKSGSQETIIGELGSGTQSGTQLGDTSVVSKEGRSKEQLEGISTRDDDLTNERPDIASPQLRSDLSGTTSRSSTYLDVQLGSIKEEDDGEKLDLGSIITVEKDDAARAPYKQTASASSSLLNTLKQKPKSRQRSGKKQSVKVVPSYSLEGFKSNSTVQSVESSTDSVADLTVKSEKMTVHDTRRNNSAYKQKLLETNKEKTRNLKPTSQEKGAQSVRIALGETLEKKQMLSSPTVAFGKSKIRIDASDVYNGGKQPDELMRLCTSTFKKRFKEQRLMPSSNLSPSTAKARVKNEARLASVGMAEEAFRPRTPPVLPGTRSGTEESHGSPTDSIGMPKKILEPHKRKGDFESDMNSLNDGGAISVGGEEYQTSTSMNGRKDREIFNEREYIDQTGYNDSQMYAKSTDSIMHHEGLVENVSMSEVADFDFTGRFKMPVVKKRLAAPQNRRKRADECAPSESSSYANVPLQKTCDDGIERRDNLAFISDTETINAFNGMQKSLENDLVITEHPWHSSSRIQQYDAIMKEGMRSVSRNTEISEADFSQRSRSARASPKGRVLFVDIPDGHMSRSETVIKSHFERLPLDNGPTKGQHKFNERTKRVLSPQEKLLKYRAASADMKCRQENAKFRRKVIDQQRRARSENRSASPTYTQDYLVDFIPDEGEETAPGMVYDYNKPTPLYQDGKLLKSERIKGSKYDRSLLARLSGQAFRHGKIITKDDDEEVIIEFIRTAINKKSGDIVLLPLQKSMPSIPTKCRDYILVTQQKNEDPKMTKVEKEILKSRFKGVSAPVTRC